MTNINREILMNFRDYIKQRGGIYLYDAKMDFLRKILLNRISVRGFKGYPQYYQFLKFHPDGEEEFKELVETFTINETCFFRNTSHFSVLEEYILPELIRERLLQNNKFLKIWSAGCSSGEEPYSLAMLISKMIPDHKNWAIEILATDINNKVLDLAKEGVYKKHSLRMVDDYYQEKYFVQGQKMFKLSEKVKKMVEFRHFNLLSEPYPSSIRGRWDIIFCCNVMMYFQLETIRQVVRNFYNSLRKGGYFFAGYAETSRMIADKFQLVRMDGAFFYKKVKVEIPVVQPMIVQHEAVRSKAIQPDGLEAYSTGGLAVVQPESEAKEIPSVQPIDLYSEAMELFIKEDYSDALNKLGAFLQDNQNDTKALLLLARIYLEKGMLSEVLSVSNKVVELDPLNDRAYYLTGFTYKQKKDFLKAIENFNKAIYLNRNNALAYYNLALVYKQMGEDKMTLREFKNSFRALNEYSPDEPLELSGNIPPKLLIENCSRNIKKLTESVNL
ncbi:MAG: CheR family methyltransferase [bacterium]